MTTLEEVISDYPIHPSIQNGVRDAYPNRKSGLGKIVGGIMKASIPFMGAYHTIKNISDGSADPNFRGIDYAENIVGGIASTVFDTSMMYTGVTAGAAIGTALLPGIGTVVGGAIGGLVGTVGRKLALNTVAYGFQAGCQIADPDGGHWYSPILDVVKQTATTAAYTGLTGAPLWILGGAVASATLRTGAKAAYMKNHRGTGDVLRAAALIPNALMAYNSESRLAGRINGTVDHGVAANVVDSDKDGNTAVHDDVYTASVLRGSADAGQMFDHGDNVINDNLVTHEPTCNSCTTAEFVDGYVAHTAWHNDVDGYLYMHDTPDGRVITVSDGYQALEGTCHDLDILVKVSGADGSHWVAFEDTTHGANIDQFLSEHGDGCYNIDAIGVGTLGADGTVYNSGCAVSDGLDLNLWESVNYTSAAHAAPVVDTHVPVDVQPTPETGHVVPNGLMINGVNTHEAPDAEMNWYIGDLNHNAAEGTLAISDENPAIAGQPFWVWDEIGNQWYGFDNPEGNYQVLDLPDGVLPGIVATGPYDPGLGMFYMTGIQ